MLLLYLLTLVVGIQTHNQLLPGSCNFESDMCDYTSDPDYSSWILHTDGHFVAVDSLGTDGQDQDTGQDDGPEKKIMGVLLSSVMDQSDWSCLRLVYQITRSGTLEVLQRMEEKSLDRPLWSSHTASDSWVIASIDLRNNTQPFRVIIKGKPGRSTGSSVSIFEIHISSGYCLECNFEESHLCGYSNQWNANVNWYVGGGGLQLLSNSMTNDHTFNNKTGHYMYVDSIHSKTFQEVAKLSSSMTTEPLSGCLSFQYQRSEDRGNLFSVYTRDRLGQYHELWKAGPENHSEWKDTLVEWMPAQVDLKAPYSIQVVFEVAFNSPRGGRVALDDISFSPEFCSKDTEPTFDPSIASCDFESGFCHYTQDQGVGSLWKRVSVKPNLFWGGDHTTGAGSFALAHSRLIPRLGYVSRLIGPTLPGNMKFCLSFVFSLRGFNQTDHALTVYLQQHSGSRLETIWTQAEKSRGIWIASDVTFQTSQPAKLVFLSTCKSFWDCGSVALDDIFVNLGDCEQITSDRSLLPSPGHCDFESGLCGYTQDKLTDNANWQWRRGPTPTSYTGPRGDHTLGLGYYLHMEASPMLPGQNVRLLSQTHRGSRGPQCLTFFYHMYGSGCGQLSIHLDNIGEEILLWRSSGEQSITWLRARVEYQSDRQHQLVFEATRGSSVRSDIAIDDITLEGGPCPETDLQATIGPSNKIE